MRRFFVSMSDSLGEAIDHWDIVTTKADSVKDFYLAAPGGIRTTEAFSQEKTMAIIRSR